MNTIARSATLLATGLALGVGAMALTAACTPDEEPTPPLPASVPADSAEITGDPEFPNITLAPCATEDSRNCYWDAQAMGNGQGTSFVDIDGRLYREVAE